MDYALAKQLKDAGFDQTYRGTTWRNREIEEVKYPTLEELIEACGKDFETLERLGEGGDFEWYATMRSYNDGERVYGKTPIEAVAKLWLELYKDKSLKKV